MLHLYDNKLQFNLMWLMLRTFIGSGTLVPPKAKLWLLLLSKPTGGTKVPLPKCHCICIYYK